MIATSPRRRGADDSGLTLIELLVTMVLMGIVSSLVVLAVAQAGRVVRHTEDEDAGLQDAKVVFDRIARDVRESRGVVCDGGLADPSEPGSQDPNCTAHLQLWVDANSDYVQQHTEIVTWRLEMNADGQHHDVWRIQGDGLDGTPMTAHRQATSLIVDTLFSYYGSADDLNGTSAPQVTCSSSVNPCEAQRVDIVMTYDSMIDAGAGERSVEFSARLRNKG